MLSILIPWLIRGVALLAVLAALYGLWWRVDHWCNAACRIAEQRATLAEEAIQIAQARATAIALLWANASENVQVVYRDKVVIREVKVAAILESAGKIKPATNAVVVPVPADA